MKLFLTILFEVAFAVKDLAIALFAISVCLLEFFLKKRIYDTTLNKKPPLLMPAVKTLPVTIDCKNKTLAQLRNIAVKIGIPRADYHGAKKAELIAMIGDHLSDLHNDPSSQCLTAAQRSPSLLSP